MEVVLEEVTQSSLETYCKVGEQAYREHYLHLWENQDPISYLQTSFTALVVAQELSNPNCFNYLINHNNTYCGILKIELNKGYQHKADSEALYLHRIYLCNAFTGKGIGKAVINQVEVLALTFKKKTIWLEAMKKGKPLNFYQNNGYQIVAETKITLGGIKPEECEMWVLAKSL